MTRRASILICLINIVIIVDGTRRRNENQPVFLGEIPNLAHGTGGKVYAVDDHTIMIKNLYYDGEAPDAYFWSGTTNKPGVTGFPIPDENGKLKPLKEYRNATVVLHLPQGKNVRNIKTIGLWCRKFQVNFGHVNLN